jgi:hypothetical protein
MCTLIATQRLGKHIPEQTNARSIKAYIARQRISKHTSLTIGAMFSSWSMQIGYKEVFEIVGQ